MRRDRRIAWLSLWVAIAFVVVAAWPESASAVRLWVDAGHGGTDPGAVYGSGSARVQEKDLNLAVALIVRDELQRYGATVGMTRTTDTFVALSDRVVAAQAWTADMFVSIHFNAAISTGANGAETLYSASDPVNGVLSARLAQLVQQEIVGSTSLRDRATVVRDGLYVLAKSGMPAIIVEGGFISNDSDRALVVDPTFQRTLGRAIARGVIAFVSEGHLEAKVPVYFSHGAKGVHTDAPRMATYTPVAGASYSVWGYFKPRRDNSEATVRVLAYRYGRKADGTSGFIYDRSFLARVTNPSGSTWSKYQATMQLPAEGRWRLRVRYYEDARTQRTTSSYRALEVR